MIHLRWSRRSYTQEEFVDAWLSSTSISEVAKKLNTNRSGSGFYTLRNTAIALGLDQSHMPETRNQRTAIKNSYSLDDILSNKVSYSNTSNLKKRLYSAKLLEKKCSICGIDEWMGKEAPLALDHINGNRNDNSIDNLRILCYNCHGQTETFGSKNKVPKI